MMLIPEYFLTACSDHAERLAIITHNDVVTWAELATRVDGFRRWLRDHGVHRQDRVVLQTPSTVGTVALMWACLLDGVTMVPVHQDLTASQVQQVIDDCRPALVCGSPDLVQLLNSPE